MRDKMVAQAAADAQFVKQAERRVGQHTELMDRLGEESRAKQQQIKELQV